MSDNELLTAESNGEAESLGTGSDLAPDTGATPEQDTNGQTPSENATEGEDSTSSGESPSGVEVTKAIHKKHFDLMEERRKNEALASRVQQLEQMLPQEQEPIVPVMPDDPYEAGYDQKLSAWQQAIQKKAEYDADQKSKSELLKQQQAQAQQHKNMQQQQVETAFVNNASKVGVSTEQLQASTQVISAYGGLKSEELTDEILQREDGPQVITYLGDNPDEVIKIQQMTPIKAAIYVSSTIAAKAVARNKTTSSAPSPVQSLGGGGSTKPDEGPPGATYE